jgi:hypothetical protein
MAPMPRAHRPCSSAKIGVPLSPSTLIGHSAAKLDHRGAVVILDYQMRLHKAAVIAPLHFER